MDYAGSYGESGVATIGGMVSGNLEFIDHDIAGVFYSSWVSLVEGESPGLIHRLPIQQTLNKGFHVIFRCSAITTPGSQKLAYKKVEVSGPGRHEYCGKGYKSKRLGDRFYIYPVAIETKGEGGYIVSAPSPGYAIIQSGENGDFYNVPTITLAEREILIRCARVLDEQIMDEPAQGGTSSGKIGRPGDDFNQRGPDAHDLLTRNGYRPCGGSEDRRHYTRPGKDRGISGTLYGGKVYHNFSGNDLHFEIGQNYAPFGILALLEHGGDFKATARELGRQGYGEPAHTTPAAANVCEGKDSPKTKVIDPLQFPDVMSGTAGRFAGLYAQYLEPPIHFFYMAFLACLGSLLSPKLSINSEIKPPARIYMVLLGASADDRKSTAIDKTVNEFFRGAVENFAVCHGVGSAEGLQKLLKDKRNLLLCLDEFKQFVSKCRIDGSVLLPFVTTLFESHKFEAHTKSSQISVDGAGLSILAASTVDTYQGVWSQAFTDIGFNNRLWLVTGRGSRKFAFPKAIPVAEKFTLINELRDVISFVGSGRCLPITDEANEEFQRWYINRDSSVHSKRLDGYALRFMQLLAINDMKPEIDLEIIRKTIALCDWQLRVRKLNDPIGADNAVARLEQNIQRQLEIRGDLTESSLIRWVNARPVGLSLFQHAIANLEKANIIEQFMAGKKKMFRIISERQAGEV